MCTGEVKTLPEGEFSAHSAMKMLLMKITIVVIILFNAKPSSAQDIIVFKSGRQIKVSIIEESDVLIKYREYGVANSPLYSIEKEMISEIKYSGRSSGGKEAGRNENKKVEATESDSGEDTAGLLTVKKRYVYQGERRLSSKNVMLLMEDLPDGLRLYEKGRRDIRISDACPVAAIILNFAAGQIVAGYDDQSQKMKIAIPTLVLDGGLIAASIVFASKGKNKIRQAVSLYNSSVKSAGPVSFRTEAGFTGNGIGVKIRF